MHVMCMHIYIKIYMHVHMYTHTYACYITYMTIYKLYTSNTPHFVFFVLLLVRANNALSFCISRWASCKASCSFLKSPKTTSFSDTPCALAVCTRLFTMFFSLSSSPSLLLGLPVKKLRKLLQYNIA